LGFPPKACFAPTEARRSRSGIFLGYLQEHQIGQVFAPVGRPQGMGKIERLHWSLKEEKLLREEI